VITTPYGRFYVDPVSVFGRVLLSGEEYEPAMCRTLEAYLKPSSVFVDLGANEGYFSVIAANIVGTRGIVLAVEPQSRLMPVLTTNCDLNNSHVTRLLHIAVYDSVGHSVLHLSPDTNPGSTSLWQSTRYKLPTEKVETLTLSELFARQAIEYADLVKMDIEGAEYEAILGSQDLFRRRRIGALAVELHPAAIQKRGLNKDDIHSFLHDAGYAIDNRFSNIVYRCMSSNGCS
jgi:FkbM family methyltransferase